MPASTAAPFLPAAPGEARLSAIDAARRALMQGAAQPHPALPGWVARSWQRCLSQGLRPERAIEFDCVSRAQMRRIEDFNHDLLHSAAPLLEQLGRAIANTRFFALLTDAQGVVIAASGAIDRADVRAERIARVGADLSERAIGTSAIGAALSELQPVWLHRGEHFFQTNVSYSCAGAPVIGPDGRCVGMVDVTGIDTHERPELRHLVLQTAQRMEAALVLARPHALLLRLNWPGATLGADGDGLLGLDEAGTVCSANESARQMLPLLQGGASRCIGDLLGISADALFEAARRQQGAWEVPLWSGLCVQVLAMFPRDAGRAPGRVAGVTDAAPLRAVESALIRNAIDLARGNVAQAAQALGISRATLYRKLGRRSGGGHGGV